jgi:N6-adenosine-specific RNA methylase IME4
VSARVIVADPPWPFDDRLPGGRGAAQHYRTLALDRIKQFPLPELEKDAVLFLWRVAAMQEEALEVARAWGFRVKAELVWAKTTDDGKRLRMGMGRTVRNCHETCLIATRGKPVCLSKRELSIFYAPRGSLHSAKPDKFFKLVQRLYAGPYVELFARRERAGWTAFGDMLEDETRAHP